MLEPLALRAQRAFLTTLFCLGARKKRGRATHKTGVGGQGILQIHPDLDLPSHDLWEPGKSFQVQLRHANLNNEDDLSADYRGAALRLLDDTGRQRLDLLMNTGEATVWCHVAMLCERMWLTLRKRLPEFYARYPKALERYWAGLRRAPEGYETLAYYSKLTGKYVARDGKLWGCRYRLLPEGWTGTDTGQPTERDRRGGVLATERWPEETRPPDTLRRAYEAQLRAGALTYRLQIAVREATRDYQHAMFDPCQPWDAKTYPWVDLATLTLDEPIPAALLEALAFNIANTPESLGVFPAKSVRDYTSIGWLRATLYAAAARQRPRDG